MAVVAAPNSAISDSTDSCPMYVAKASKMMTAYMYGCAIPALQASKSSPVASMGPSRKGIPTMVVQNRSSVCDNRSTRLACFLNAIQIE